MSLTFNPFHTYGIARMVGSESFARKSIKFSTSCYQGIFACEELRSVFGKINVGGQGRSFYAYHKYYMISSCYIPAPMVPHGDIRTNGIALV